MDPLEIPPTPTFTPPPFLDEDPPKAVLNEESKSTSDDAIAKSVHVEDGPPAEAPPTLPTSQTLPIIATKGKVIILKQDTNPHKRRGTVDVISSKPKEEPPHFRRGTVNGGVGIKDHAANEISSSSEKRALKHAKSEGALKKKRSVTVEIEQAPREENPLHKAVTLRKTSTVKNILKKSVTQTELNQQNVIGKTPLLLAAEDFNMKIATLLMSQNPDINLPDDNGDTPILIASRKYELSVKKDPKLLKLLLQQKKIKLTTKNKDGKTALDFSPFKEYINENWKKDKKISEKDARKLCRECLGVTVEKKPKQEDPAMSKRKDTQLHRACFWGKVRDVRSILEKGIIPVNQRSSSGDVALGIAASEGHYDICALLISHNADVNLKDDWGNTPAMNACINVERSIIKLMLQQKKLDPAKMNNDGRRIWNFRPFDTAESCAPLQDEKGYKDYTSAEIKKMLKQALNMEPRGVISFSPKRMRRLEKGKLFNVYVNFSIGESEKETTVCRNCVQPSWDNEFYSLDVFDMNSKIVIEAFDVTQKSQDVIGKTEVTPKDFEKEESGKSYNLKLMRKGEKGKVELEIEITFNTYEGSQEEIGDKIKLIDDALLTDDLDFAMELCSLEIPPNDLVAGSLAKIFEANGRLNDFMGKLLTREIENTTVASTLFRTDSWATKCLRFYMKQSLSAFLEAVIGPLIEVLQGGDISCEMDPMRIQEGDDVDRHKENLIKISTSLIENVFASVKEIPVPMKLVFKTLYDVVGEKFEENKLKAIGGFLFLRYLCVAIWSPEVYGLMDDPFPPKIRRNAVLISKVIVNLANGVEFAYKEPYMISLNPFLHQHFGRLIGFYDVVLNVEEEELEESVPQMRLRSVDYSTVYKHFSTYKKTVQRNFPDIKL